MVMADAVAEFGEIDIGIRIAAGIGIILKPRIPDGGPDVARRLAGYLRQGAKPAAEIIVAQHVIHVENDEAWWHRSSRRSANRQPVDAQGGLADAHRNALALLAAGADARIKRHVIAHHGNAGEGIGT